MTWSVIVLKMIKYLSWILTLGSSLHLLQVVSAYSTLKSFFKEHSYTFNGGKERDIYDELIKGDLGLYLTME